jgi:hypothetical protein
VGLTVVEEVDSVSMPSDSSVSLAAWRPEEVADFIEKAANELS